MFYLVVGRAASAAAAAAERQPTQPKQPKHRRTIFCLFVCLFHLKQIFELFVSRGEKLFPSFTFWKNFEAKKQKNVCYKF